MASPQSFFFYDLETSGLNPRHDRIMQFAGQRTDMEFKPIGEPINLLVKTTEDILPSPSAILVTGITPQKTLRDGLTEAEFTKFLQKEVFTPGTIVVGYNNVRFDDEFMRHTFWRNFHDPYEWEWKDDRSRWDLLDVVRLVRALRPEGINWPVIIKDGEKVSTNNLVDLAKQNGFENKQAHDALADVNALISLTKLVKEKQPKIFDYLLKHRGKTEVAKLVNLENPQPFVYASGRYSNEHEKTVIAIPVAPGKNPGTVLVYDLTRDINEYKNYTKTEFEQAVLPRYRQKDPEHPLSLPVKELNYGRCPAVAPTKVLDKETQQRIGVFIDQAENNLAELKRNQGVLDKIIAAWRDQPEYASSKDVEGQLYDSFTPDDDKPRIRQIPQLTLEELADYHPNFTDERLPELLLRYKARNFPKAMSETEQAKWLQYRAERFNARIQEYLKELQKLHEEGRDDFILQELQLWAESIYPEPED